MPPLEAWEKVLIKVSANKTIADVDIHLDVLECTDCHRGNPAELEDYEIAHEGMVLDPASLEENACGKCHASIADKFNQSLHMQLWGEKETLAARTGVAEFGQCPQKVQDGFKGECAACHATCGDCHVSRPDSVGKGFVDSHKFNSKPHQKNQCMACHGSRVAYDYMGDTEAGRAPSAHFAKGMDCMKCHTGKEMHADASDVVGGRYHLPEAPRCEDCHDIPNANEYHSTHWDDLACQVCHSQPYNNCTECHLGGEWKTDEAYHEENPAVDFRIGRNPLPSRRFEFVAVRHAPVYPGSFENWGAKEAMTDYEALPTWKFATPHNVRRWTERTEVSGDAGCAASCHVGAPMGDPANVQYYLFQDYVESNWPLEVEANKPVFVDDALPDGWK